LYGAQGETRTRMALLPRDFKSLVATSYTTWAILILRPRWDLHPRMAVLQTAVLLLHHTANIV
jgi:hypothetical protein